MDELEEGEITSDTDPDDYTPLERPANYSQLQQPHNRFPVNLPESESEEQESSESDSDSDVPVKKPKVKKPKLKIKPVQRHCSTKKKYEIWSARLKDDVLSESLNNCGVGTVDNSRSVESYNYELAWKLREDCNGRTNNKRTRDDRNNANFRQRQRSRSRSRENAVTEQPRHILELAVTSSYSPEDIAKDIANKLGEEREDIVLKVVNIMGKDKSIDIFKETREIESIGGMMTLNKTRRRTPGGVFFYLVRTDYDITPKQRKEIFDDEQNKSSEAAKEKKRRKRERYKQKIALCRSKILPDLLSKAELLASGNNRMRKETDGTEDVINPPPTPETDGHDNSGDGMEAAKNVSMNNVGSSRGTLQSYEDDFLDLHENEMDLF